MIDPSIYAFLTGFRAQARVVKPVARPRKRLKKVCEFCQLPFFPKPYRAKTVRFCGQPCQSADTRVRNRVAAKGKK